MVAQLELKAANSLFPFPCHVSPPNLFSFFFFFPPMASLKRSSSYSPTTTHTGHHGRGCLYKPCPTNLAKIRFHKCPYAQFTATTTLNLHSVISSNFDFYFWQTWYPRTQLPVYFLGVPILLAKSELFSSEFHACSWLLHCFLANWSRI